MGLDTLHHKIRREGDASPEIAQRVRNIHASYSDVEALYAAYYRDEPVPAYDPVAEATAYAQQAAPAHVAQAAGSAEFWNEMQQPAPVQVNAAEQAALDAVYAAHAQAGQPRN
jgi:hypothetical protein